MARILVCALVVVIWGFYANGNFSIDDICNKHKDHGRCENQRIKTMCSKQCGGGEEQTPPDEETTKQPPTTRRTVTNRPAPRPPPSANNGGGGGGGGNKNCDKRSPCVSYEEANKAFRARCIAATNGALTEECYAHCRYDQDQQGVKKAFIGGPCPVSQLRTFITAASGGKDNTACCEDQGVLSQKKTNVCGCFCYPTGPAWPDRSNASKYLPCVSVLSGIIDCHYFAEGAA